mmetsp:Transcript_62189/g.151664  ORF Transcript_62189/g.151664 Transcript_62189/m.151664 type:complete len:313 (-) Transcript_62189:136-1074(-)|eukprot:CAMPEP_0113479950 /NCGR_PEP_ID=MMETSP0014_2-20120614/21596_1 /TAXON_ID=2857 /ORGANISM="Nitzschia sp." /LENGTH=312 /DNA_ID=CAMNT_0000373309 /DNA_START=170 /DNA_END=1111 /DNA_ORIENTATION=+ /assembly_acc=CAM_ASM_000159
MTTSSAHEKKTTRPSSSTTTTTTTAGDCDDNNDKTGVYLTKHRDRRNYVLRLSFLPVLICVISFAKAAYYRFWRRPKPSQCQDFGWYSSSSGEFQCDYKPLDYHAMLALLWLGTYALQTSLIAAGLPSIHRLTGKVGFIIAFANAAGMFYLAIQDTLNPMPKTDRPPDFTPFMFLVAIKLTICLVVSVIKIRRKDTEGHILWTYRAFTTSFTTPVIRFYPLVLRLLAGDDCFDRNRQKFVMGAMFVSELTCSVLYSLVQRKTRKVFWDTFMKIQAVTFLCAFMKDVKFASENGFFVTGMIQCWTEKMATDEL